jgi:uncharacterized RDD family membrane protein YckC
MHADSYAGPMAGLPDPEHDRQFYERVPLRRFIAWCIDVTIVLLVGVPLALIFGLVTLGLGFGLFPLVVAAVGFVYRTATLAGASATWGMWFTGIEFRRGDGTRFDPMTAFLHTTLYMICMSVVVLQAISCVTILGSRYRQSLGDMLLGTTAINRPAD